MTNKHAAEGGEQTSNANLDTYVVNEDGTWLMAMVDTIEGADSLLQEYYDDCGFDEDDEERYEVNWRKGFWRKGNELADEDTDYYYFTLDKKLAEGIAYDTDLTDV